MTKPEDEKKSQTDDQLDADEDDWDDWDDDDDDESSGDRMGFLDHLGELRDRLFKVILALLIGVMVTFNFADFLWVVIENPAEAMLKTAQEKSLAMVRSSDEIVIELPEFDKLPDPINQQEGGDELVDYLEDWREDASETLNEQIKNILKAKDSRLMQTSITEAFFLKIKISFFGAILLVYPYIMFQIWAFVAPGLYRKERRMALPFIIFTTMFFGLGVAFAYYIAVPFAGTFLMSFGAEFVQMITIEKYMDFLTTMMLGLGIVFEIPMVIFVLARLGIVTPRFLIKNFRYAVLLIVIIAAVITPTGDPINLAVFSIPMMLLYMLGVLIAKFLGKKERETDWDDDWDDDDEDDDEETEEVEEADEGVADPYEDFYEDEDEENRE